MGSAQGQGAMGSESIKPGGWKQRLVKETQEYLAVALFLSALLSALTSYRRLLMSEVGVPYLHYGYAIVEALVLAKIILIGEALHIGWRLKDKPLIVSALYKSIAYGLLTFAARVLEEVLHALVTRESLAATWARQTSKPAEIGAYTLVLFVSFVPLFSLQGAGRLLGTNRFLSLLLIRPEDVAGPAHHGPPSGKE